VSVDGQKGSGGTGPLLRRVLPKEKGGSRGGGGGVEIKKKSSGRERREMAKDQNFGWVVTGRATKPDRPYQSPGKGPEGLGKKGLYLAASFKDCEK